MSTDERDDQASPLELFFDLAFVAALALLTKVFVKDLSWYGAAEALVLLVALYAVWSATTFAAMLPEVRRTSAQWVVIAVMLLVVFMAAALDEAWKDGPLWFLVPYLACRVGHATATVALNPEPASRSYQGAALAWIVASAPFWLAGAFVEGDSRLLLWAGAAALDLVGAWWAHPVPRRMRRDDGLSFDADRLVERCRLFLLLVLGETLLTTGLVLAEAPQEAWTLVAGALAFSCIVSLWLLYFGSSDHHVERDLDRASDALRTARRVLAAQFFVAAGLVALAAGLDDVLAHPTKAASGAVVLLLCGGPVLYLLVQAWYLHLVAGGTPAKRLAGATVIALVCPVLLLLPAVGALGVIAAVLAVEAAVVLRGPGAVG